MSALALALASHLNALWLRFFFFVMGKGLSGGLSCMRTDLVNIMCLSIG